MGREAKGQIVKLELLIIRLLVAICWRSELRAEPHGAHSSVNAVPDTNKLKRPIHEVGIGCSSGSTRSVHSNFVVQEVRPVPPPLGPFGASENKCAWRGGSLTPLCRTADAS